MDLNLTSTGANRGELPLRGLRLRVLQALWVLLVLCDLLVLIVGLPAFYRGLHAICTTPSPNCQDDQLTPQALAALQHAGLSLHTYALYVFSWDMLTTLAFLLVGAVIIWRRATTWMGPFVSFPLKTCTTKQKMPSYNLNLSPNCSDRWKRSGESRLCFRLQDDRIAQTLQLSNEPLLNLLFIYVGKVINSFLVVGLTGLDQGTRKSRGYCDRQPSPLS
jgi:hypothetical protein